MIDDLTDKTQNPVELFQKWLAEAEEKEAVNPNAMALATADAEGRPSVRMVLLKSVDENGFVFYTNSESRKGLEIKANPMASLCFYWKSLRREVRVDGAVSKVSDTESDAYFESRDKASQIGAWASQQSRPLTGRFEFEKEIARYTAKFNIGKVPRPDYWEGYRILPERIEFWTERRFRLHDRMMYTRSKRTSDKNSWTVQRLYP